MSRAFASQGDVAHKAVTFHELVPQRAYAYTAEGDPNTGIVITDSGVVVIDTQATPRMAQDVIARIGSVTDRPVTHIVLTHYHAVRVLGASAYGAHTIIASQPTHELIAERGEADMASEIARFPRLFRGAETIPGLTWPSVIFHERLKLRLGGVEIEIMQPGAGHTRGDTVVWLPEHRVLFAGDLVEYGATPYAGDAHLGDWPRTLDRLAALEPLALVPGRGAAVTGRAESQAAIAGTRRFVTELYATVQAAVRQGKALQQVYRETVERLRPTYGQWVIFDHCMPFDVSRAFDEARGLDRPRIWTAERDREMWAALEG
jgi:glyoxylase-like metal-dependent hydrolase (beta-lactamase superfamily II)